MEGRVSPAAGALDPTFGVGGLATTRFPAPSHEGGNAIAIDGLGRIVVAGSAANGSTTFNGEASYDFAVARFTSNGALDASFGVNGSVVFNFGALSSEANAVAIDSLDRVIVVGVTRMSALDSDFAVARLTAAGALDATFDGDGKQTISFGASTDEARGVAIDSVDRLVVAGYMSNGLSFAVARLTATGALDGAFDGDGKLTIDFGTGSGSAYDVAIDSAQRIVVAGSIVFGDAQGLYRFYGDINGDRRVDIADFGLFSRSFMNAANYVAAFDYNGDGRIDIVDFGRFSLRYFTMLP